MLFRAALLLGAAVLPLSAVAQASPQTAAPAAAPVKPIAFTERTLANGLRVYAIHDPSTANVSVNVGYDVGSKDDPKGRSGFAHMFEHLMFKATRNLVPEQMDRSEEHTSELQPLMRTSYAVCCLNKKTTCNNNHH